MQIKTDDAPLAASPLGDELTRKVQAHYRAASAIRRGVCLLNAGQYDEAAKVFTQAAELDGAALPLPSLLAACLLGAHDSDAAVERLEEAVEAGPAHTGARVRLALALWKAGRPDEAMTRLRDEIRRVPENAEFHFQLGVLLASTEQYEEAELRFTQAVTIDRDHTEALVNLAMCCGIRHAPTEAVTYLKRAQMRRPHDARIALLLAQATRAANQSDIPVYVRAEMPPEDLLADRPGVEELSRVIESEPDFVDAFLSIPIGAVDPRVFAMLLRTLEMALERQPQQAELHFHCGRVLDRLGRCEDAICENERAIQLDPKYTRALIELGELYHKTDRGTDATARLEQAVHNGADYADVHYLLGNLYRDQGQPQRARRAYRRALALDHEYAQARQALEALMV